MQEFRIVQEATALRSFRDQNENPQRLEDFRAVVKNLTENAMKVLNQLMVDEMGNPEPKAQLIENYSLLFHYLDFMKRFVSSNG